MLRIRAEIGNFSIPFPKRGDKWILKAFIDEGYSGKRSSSSFVECGYSCRWPSCWMYSACKAMPQIAGTLSRESKRKGG